LTLQTESVFGVRHVLMSNTYTTLLDVVTFNHFPKLLWCLLVIVVSDVRVCQCLMLCWAIWGNTWHWSGDRETYFHGLTWDENQWLWSDSIVLKKSWLWMVVVLVQATEQVVWP